MKITEDSFVTFWIYSQKLKNNIANYGGILMR